MRMQLRDPYEPEVSEERCSRCDKWGLLGDGLCVTCYDKSAEKADKYQIKEGRGNAKYNQTETFHGRCFSQLRR